MSDWVDAFIVIAAIAIVIQMVILLALLLQVRTAIQNFTQIASQLQARIDPILLRTNRILEDSESRISSIMGDAAEFTHLARTQAQKVDRIFTDTIERLRVQIVRADHILSGALEVIEDTGTTVREKLWQPLNQASAVIKGIKAGLDYFRGQKRQSEPDQASQDQELFI
jgi:ABC-type transporter Mla subunit MlaD